MIEISITDFGAPCIWLISSLIIPAPLLLPAG